jgi:hypothetical protein
MGVEARFWVDEITTRAYNPDHVSVTLRAAGRGEGNKSWAQATPTGTIELTITNPAAAEFFKENQGKDVAILFAPVEMEPKTSQHG